MLQFLFFLSLLLNWLFAAAYYTASGVLARGSAVRALLASPPFFKKRQKSNAPGNAFVDESCIDCDVCRWMCPSVFQRAGLKAVVGRQPTSPDEMRHFAAAAVACPVGAIRTETPYPGMKDAVNMYPVAINPSRLPGVMHLGYHSPKTLATPYLITHPQGNVMIDTPRFNARLAQRLQSMGGVQTLVITHKDDIGDHDKWKKYFPSMQRVIHSVDVTFDSKDIEVQLDGSGKWSPLENVTIIHTPGHTAGSLCILFRSRAESVLFSGDHLSFNARRGALEGFKAFNHGNEKLQAASMRMLAEDRYPFLWILPAHGRMVRFNSQDEKREAILEAAERYESDDGAEDLFGGLRVM